MNRDSRLSVALHVLLHMREKEAALTSEAIGEMMDTNPVVIRRTLGGLREAGIVSAVKGHGGGWSLARDLRTVNVADVYAATAPSSLFGIGPRDPDAACPLERAVNQVVEEALTEAEALVIERLGGIAVADLVDKAVEARRRERTQTSRSHHVRRHHRGR